MVPRQIEPYTKQDDESIGADRFGKRTEKKFSGEYLGNIHGLLPWSLFHYGPENEHGPVMEMFSRMNWIVHLY